MEKLKMAFIKDPENKFPMKLSGNTFRVYWYVLANSKKSVGVRAVQRAMGFSSPSTALYHLEKLRHCGLVSKDDMGNYFAKRSIRSLAMQNFIFLGNLIIPRHLIYAVLTTMISLVYFVLLRDSLSYPLIVVSLLPSIISSMLFWCETLVVWKSKPKLS
jgi:DNA-binding transcriptional ArsR family regulator